jgi:predicted permease
MGLPICLFAYGAKGFGVASAVAAIIMLLHFTVGVFLAKKKFDANLIFKTPAFYAILFSVGFLYFELNPPTFLINLTMLLIVCYNFFSFDVFRYCTHKIKDF